MSDKRILLIDAYDSFTYNLHDQLSRCTSAEIYTIRIDTPFKSTSELVPFLASFDAVVVGPGPGSPRNPDDIGVAKGIWTLSDSDVLPIFGVCLGLQSLCLECGGSVKPLPAVKHGLTCSINHVAYDLFEGLGSGRVVRYHSLYAELPESDTLEALAWATDDENGEVLMAARHKTKPFWGVQYHPESICTEEGDQVVANFWKLANNWSITHGRRTAPLAPNWPTPPRPNNLLQRLRRIHSSNPSPRGPTQGRKVSTCLYQSHGLTVHNICELIGVKSAREFALLDSAAVPGKWCIIGVLSPGITRFFKYHVGDKFVTVSRLGSPDSESLCIDLSQDYSGSVWLYLADLMHKNRATGGNPVLPFWGGLMGYMSYELGVEALSIPSRSQSRTRPDVNLVFVDRSLVMDPASGHIYVQSVIDNDNEWLHSMRQLLQQADDLIVTPSPTPIPPIGRLSETINAGESDACQGITANRSLIAPPERERYGATFTQAQSHLASGDSYELCVTTRAKAQLLPYLSTWDLYLRLHSRNPAPYAGYIRLQGVTLLSSSPERFLAYGRDGNVELRPIKGTVKKGPGMTPEKAEEILQSPKERAENLMILDLIRHDLFRVLGPGNVSVDQLMSVEEYASVYQLVSVIRGTLPKNPGLPLTGLDILSSSLPPGSMTGAPKKRSVELLQILESEYEARGVYSGIVGYMSVCGAGDWSVIIRSAYRYDNEDDCWWIGAGGAVTALSTLDGEFDEMNTKLDSTAAAFRN